MQSIGDTVKVRGTYYRVVEVRNSNGLGSKFYGKFAYTVRDDAGNLFTGYGKSIAHNSRLTPKSQPENAENRA